jgi:hypothetical protein
MEQHPVNVLVEGITDEAVVRALLTFKGLGCGPVYGLNGKAHLLARLPNYAQAARFAPWLAVIDLDRTGCAPDLRRESLPDAPPSFIYRIAVRAIEAWLMGDRESLAHYLSISPANVPRDPDAEPDPKLTLVTLARRSRLSRVRDMVPGENSMARVGPGYTTHMITFASQYWRPDVAALHSDSLARCIRALDALKANAAGEP